MILSVFIGDLEKLNGHCQHNIPSHRKLEQFDQIMNLYGIWDKMKWKMVNQNLTDGTFKVEQDLVFDPSHVPIDAVLVEKQYEKGIKASAKQLNSLNIKHHEINPPWNYTISPNV